MGINPAIKLNDTLFKEDNVHFLIDCGITIHIHLLKHRIFSRNARPAYYKELKEDKNHHLIYCKL